MKEKVLITGASGFLGFHIINAALDAGLEVFAAVRNSSNLKHLESLSVKFIQLNYQSVSEMSSLIDKGNFSYIIHAAGITKANTLEEYDLINNVYSTNLALAAAQNSECVKRFVFISSLAAVGPVKMSRQCIDENTVTAPVTAYGKSKLDAEKNILKQNLPVTILRPTAIYGPREKDIFIIASQVSKGLELYIGKKQQKLSFVHGKDVGVLAVNALFADNKNGIYNISDGKTYSRYDFASIVKSILSKKTIQLHLPVGLVKIILFFVETGHKMLNKVPPVNREKLQELMAENWICDISKAKEELNFLPIYDLESGLKDTIKWYRENKWL